MDPFAQVSSAAHSGAYGINNLPEPSLANLRAGNYRKGRCEIHGLRIAIETPQGQRRAGKANGEPWSVICYAHYGYIEKTRGADGDELDVFIGPWPESEMVYVVNRGNASGGFDEHKLLMGFTDRESAVTAYRNSYERGADGILSIVPCTVDQLKWWIQFGNYKIPLTSNQLPFDGTATMNDVTWDTAANPVGLTLPQLLYAMRRDDAEDRLLLDSVTQADVLEDSDGEAVLDALVVPLNRLERKMGQMQVIMRAASKAVRPGILQITPPFKQRGTTNVAAIFEMDDGQTVTVYFHNPDATPNKLTPDDEMVSWKWMLNKKDVTIVVAPERGMELNPREVARRIMRLVEANSARFQAANARRAERMAGIEAGKASVAAKQAELDALNAEAAALEERVEAKRAGAPAVLQQGVGPDQRLAAVRDAMGRLGWNVTPGYLEMTIRIDGSMYGVKAETTETSVRWLDTGSERVWEDEPSLTADQMAAKIDSEFRGAIDAAKAKLARSGSPEEQAAADAALAMAAQVVAELGGTFTADGFSGEGVAGAWSYGDAKVNGMTIRLAASGGGVVQVNRKPHDPDGVVITTPEQVRRSILALAPDWKAVDPTTESGYRIVRGAGEQALLYHQDQLDHFFNGRYIAIRNALRALGWADDGSKQMMSGPLKKGEYELIPKIQSVGAGRNVVNIAYEIKGVPGFVMPDTLAHTPEQMAERINMGLPQAKEPDSIMAGALAALEAAGWSRGTGSAIATKAFNTVSGQQDALAFLTDGDEYNRTLKFEFTSEGRNVAAADLAMIPVAATSEEAKSLVAQAAERAEKSIRDSYGVRLADEGDPVVEEAVRLVREAKGGIAKLATSNYFTFEFEGDDIVFNDEMRAAVETALGEKVKAVILPGLEGQESIVPESYGVSPAAEVARPLVKQGERVIFKKEWQDAGDDGAIFIALHDESNGRVTVVHANSTMFIKPTSTALSKHIERSEPVPATADLLVSAKAYLATVIDGTADLADPEVADKLTALYETHNGNAEFDGLFAKAADAYQAFMVDAAKKAMGG